MWGKRAIAVKDQPTGSRCLSAFAAACPAYGRPLSGKDPRAPAYTVVDAMPEVKVLPRAVGLSGGVGLDALGAGLTAWRCAHPRRAR